MRVQIHQSWENKLTFAFAQPDFEALVGFVKSEYKHHHCYPPGKMIFEAFNACPFEEVKVVVLGQDPYHGPGQAHGLSFSVPDGVGHPPSLMNIFKEIEQFPLHKCAYFQYPRENKQIFMKKMHPLPSKFSIQL